MKKAFSLVELLIVVAILGILAAIALPVFQSHTQQAREAAAKDNLRILRNVIELYAAQHDGVPPGYSNNEPPNVGTHLILFRQLITNGNYLPELPTNPFNNCNATKLIGDDAEFPTEPFSIGVYGWIYQPATRTIKLNWPGTDSAGIAYFDY
ncbi:MAG: hypothetical protein AMJ43_08475 [Coxiella sp. DG_40]|nr:MAG: hypothetical protein AMJ43_08475 [Coxiella sp. DG_40]